MLEAAVLVRAHAQAVEDGGDAGGDDLGVVGLDRGRLVPAQAGARRIVAFQMVGVQFDEAGDQVVALEVLAERGVAVGDIGDLAVADQHASRRRSRPRERCGRWRRRFLWSCQIVFQLLAPASGSQDMNFETARRASPR